MVGGKAAAEAGAVTHGAVRCSIVRRFGHLDLLDESPCWDWFALRLMRATERKTMQSEKYITDCAMWVR